MSCFKCWKCLSEQTDQYVMHGYSFSVLVGMTGSLRSSALVVKSLHTVQTTFSATCSWIFKLGVLSLFTPRQGIRNTSLLQYHRRLSEYFYNILENTTKILQNFVFQTVYCNYSMSMYKYTKHPIPQFTTKQHFYSEITNTWWYPYKSRE